jgi:hypothetical protein
MNQRWTRSLSEYPRTWPDFARSGWVSVLELKVTGFD